MKELDMKKIEITLDSLRKNNMEAYYCDSSQDAVELVKTLIKKGDTVTHGGSETLKETKVLDLLKNGDYTYLDRSACKDKDEIEEVYRKAYFADAYFASSNAVTENGVLYNVDGNSNRVSAILYGPKSVIMLCGYNKVVRDLDEAVYRVKTVAAPKNTKRLNCPTFCKENGQCLSIGSDASYMCDGCNSDGRICCNYVVSAKQRQKGRIKVILIGEKLGY